MGEEGGTNSMVSLGLKRALPKSRAGNSGAAMLRVSYKCFESQTISLRDKAARSIKPQTQNTKNIWHYD
jgi:hypothetical protein